MERKIVYQTADFRKYESETLKDHTGKLVIVTVCEDLVEGRWEPFVSVRPVKS
jgi:hypothetical protein